MTHSLLYIVNTIIRKSEILSQNIIAICVCCL